jgi:hypothetical protein
MSQLFPLFEEESSNGDCASGLFSHLNFRLNDGFQSITIHENKFEPKDISSQLFERELPKELNEPNNKIIAQTNKEKSNTFPKGKIFRSIKPNLEKLMEFNYNEINGTYFPFSPGRGIENVIESFGYKAILKSPHCISISTSNDIIIQINSSNNKLNEEKLKCKKKKRPLKRKTKGRQNLMISEKK